jgi:hypothetical protein
MVEPFRSSNVQSRAGEIDACPLHCKPVTVGNREVHVARTVSWEKESLCCETVQQDVLRTAFCGLESLLHHFVLDRVKPTEMHKIDTEFAKLAFGMRQERSFGIYFVVVEDFCTVAKITSE